MSRVGRMPIEIPAGVTVDVAAGNLVTVKGAKGTLTQKLNAQMNIKKEDNSIVIERPSDQKEHKALHGLTRALLANMVKGVNETFTKTLEVNGVGYRVQKNGKELVLNIGYSHQVTVTDTEHCTTAVDGNKIIVSGADKQKVGQFAAEIREKRPPEPYKGKGIKYIDEVIRRKEGKAGGKKK